MTENRNGFVVEAELRQVSGTVERETAKDMIVRYSPGAKRITVGADRELQSDSSGGTTRVGTGNDLGSPDPSVACHQGRRGLRRQHGR